MSWESWIAPAVVAAVVSGFISIVGMFVNRATTFRVHKEKLDADRDLAERKFAFDKELADDKFKFEKNLALQKVNIDLECAVWQRNQALAEEVLAGFYEVQEVLRAARSPGAFASEGRSRNRGPDEDDDVAEAKNTYYVPLERLERHRKTVAELLSRKYRMAACFGAELAQPFDELNFVANKIERAAWELVAIVDDKRRNSDYERRRMLEAAIWAGGENDPIDKAISDAVLRIEAICRPLLASQVLPKAA